MLKLFCLGTLRLEVDAAPVTLTPKANALLLYLAVTQRAHSRDRLADLLWSEMNNQQARDNLRYLLPELRRPLRDYLVITARNITFHQQSPAWVDMVQLRESLTGQPEAIATSTLQAALALYQGEFLAGFNVRNAPVFEAWVVQQREGLHTLAVQSAYTLAERYWQQADYQAALTATQRLLQWEPWHEAGHRLRMQLLAATGQRAAALAHYDRCRTILAEELAVEPEAATVALYEQLRAGAFDKVTSDKVTNDRVTIDHPVTLSPPHPVTLSPPHNLPSQLTPFFGRATEIAQISTLLLGDHARLFNLVGEGGIGKTRLALAIGQNIVEATAPVLSDDQNQKSKACPGRIKNQKFPDGVWWVGLAGLTPTESIREQLAVAVAQAIGLSFGGTQPLFTQLLAQIRTKALLFLCDNAEHLLPGLADFLLTLLEACPRITVLVTSRHLLNLQAEFVWRLDGLPLPSPAELQAPATTGLHQYSSIALFLARARRQPQNFATTAEEQRAIAEICRLLEGLPLAIELAAALTRQYTYTALYAALQQDYTILATGLRDLAPRHRSIQAMLDYSWRFLTPDAAYTLAACARFVGGFTREAACAVTNATPDLLHELVDQSLLQRRAGHFTMHELVRQYAMAQLTQSPERHHTIKARHAAYYSQQLQALATALLVEPAAQERFQRELDNLRLAWYWSAEQGDLALLAQGAVGLEYGCRVTGLYREAIQLLDAALLAVRQAIIASNGSQTGYALLARLLCYAAEFYRRTGNLAVGERLATEALVLGQQLAMPALQGLAYHELTRRALLAGDFSTMHTLAEQGVAQARLANDLPLLVECLHGLGIARGACIGPDAAIPQFHEALDCLQGTAYRLLQGTVLDTLALYYLIGHNYQAAYGAFRQGAPLGYSSRSQEGRGLGLIHQGDLWVALGQYTRAQQTYDQALVIIQAIQVPQWASWLYASYGRLHHLCSDLAAAHHACISGVQVVTTHQVHVQKQWLLINWGHLLTDQGDLTAARTCYEQAIALPKQVNCIYRTADAHAGLAALLLQTNEVALAVTHVEAALAHFAQLGLAGAHEPFTVYWTAVRVFTAASDLRATAVLRTACQQLQAIAGTLEEAEMRRAFLENVVVNRQLLAAAQAAAAR